MGTEETAIIAPLSRPSEDAMTKALTVLLFVAVVAAQGALPQYPRVLNLEHTSDDSANVSVGDLDGDGDFDIALANGRHTPLVDRISLNDGKGNFPAPCIAIPAGSATSIVAADFDDAPHRPCRSRT